MFGNYGYGPYQGGQTLKQIKDAELAEAKANGSVPPRPFGLVGTNLTGPFDPLGPDTDESQDGTEPAVTVPAATDKVTEADRNLLESLGLPRDGSDPDPQGLPQTHDDAFGK
jgi:hypothetical protein